MKYLVIVIIIGLILYMLWREFKKKDETVSNIAIFTLGISLVFASTGDKYDWILKFVAIVKNREYALEMTQEFNMPFFIFGASLIILSIFLTYYKKTKVKVLNINGYLKKSIEENIKQSKGLRKDIKEYEIDFIDIYTRIFKEHLDKESCNCILEKIKKDVNAFKNYSKECKRGYTGIAPIPFITYAGTFFEREEINEYYEFDKIKTNAYYKLKDKIIKPYPKLKLKQEVEALDKSKKEVVIAISTTANITESQLSQFKDKCNILSLEVDLPKDNIIKSKQQLKEYLDTIFSTIQIISEKFDKIENIHLICSSQSCLVLEIGKRCVDDTRLPQITSYQYEAQSAIKYPWGIRINGKNKGELIVCEKER